MRTLRAIAAALLLVSCGSTADDEPVLAPVAPAPAPDPRVAEMHVLLSELLDRMEVMNSRLQRLESGAPSSQPAAPAPATAAAPAQPLRRVTPLSPAAIGDTYREALVLFGRGRIDDSRAAFQKIFDADPGGDLADNALYWIGETWFVQARYKEAIDIYQRLVAEYGSENKAPDALLKTGLAYAKLGDLAMARSTLQSLIERYPYSTPAASARLEIERIKY